MCRQNQLWGIALITFGAGVLLGAWLAKGFFTTCFAVGIGVIGFGFIRR